MIQSLKTLARNGSYITVGKERVICLPHYVYLMDTIDIEGSSSKAPMSWIRPVRNQLFQILIYVPVREY